MKSRRNRFIEIDDIFILIPGRTSRQGTTLNEGKFTADYLDETHTLFMGSDDMKRLGVVDGESVCVRSDFGHVKLPCRVAKEGELPSGLLFLPYGDPSSRLMGGETHCTGMPDSKGLTFESRRLPFLKETSEMVEVATKIVKNATCTFCGCVCDDMELSVEGHTITKAKNACVLGKGWFLNHHIEDRPVAMIEGRPATLEEGIERAAQILESARYPIVYGLSDTTCEAQRVAVSLADRIGGCVDTTTSVCHGPSGMAFQGVGEVTCTLGEVKNRADLVIFWGGNPAESHPRHWGRYSLMPKGLFSPEGRKGRTAVLVDVRKSKSAAAADIFLQIKLRKDFEVLWALRALVKGIETPASIGEEAGISVEQLKDLVKRMKECKFGIIFFGMGLSMTRGKHMNVEAALSLARDLNEYTRFYSKPVRGHGNVTGADNVVSWQTGFPFGVSLGRGYPRFNPGEFTTSDTLARGEADAGLIIASDPMGNFSQPAREHLAKIPYIALDPKETSTVRGATVAFCTATYGINVPGTVYRMDDVPIPLRPAFESSFPSDETVLRGIERRVPELQRERAAREGSGRS